MRHWPAASGAAGAAFHCDAVQAVGKLPVHFHDLGVTTLTLERPQVPRPKGVGALLLRRGRQAAAAAVGRPSAAGPAARAPSRWPWRSAWPRPWNCAAPARRTRDGDTSLRLRQRFLDTAAAERPRRWSLNGPAEGGVPHTLNLSFPGCRADVAADEPRPGRRGLLDRLGLFQRLAAAVAGAAGDGRAGRRCCTRRCASASAPLLSEAEIDEAARRIAAVVRRLRQSSEE